MAATAPPGSHCGLCGGALELLYRGQPGAANLAELAPTFHRPGAHADLLRCRECAAVQQPALPGGEELLGLYRPMRDPDYLDEERGRRETARRLLELIRRYAPGPRLLDVGCGHGLLLDEARTMGFEVVGLEPAAEAARYARETFHLDVREEGLSGADLEGATFDAVVLADVLEHVDDPQAAIDAARELLAPGGVLLVATPDPASATARIAGRRWWGYLPAHTYLIPRTTLRELISARGLVIAEDIPLSRSFTVGYWMRGLAERAGVARGLRAIGESVFGRKRSLTLSLGDERVIVAQLPEIARPSSPRASDRGEEQKVHAVLPAYNAAETVTEVAEGLPVGAVDRALLVDDASSDHTAAAALASGLEVLVHPRNRGYGANQKTCYVRAILDGADVVVMVHADNQYDPSLVARMVEPIVNGAADVVIGSRLLQDEAIAGGMPRWRWVGNRLLTWIENRAFRRRFSEYHTGYRAFSAELLKRIPFLRNDDGFVFDQAIFAQALAAGARVVELPIPTRYFLEASSVSFGRSVEYGLRTLWVLVRYRLDERRRRWALLRRPAVRLGPASGYRAAAADPPSGR